MSKLFRFLALVAMFGFGSVALAASASDDGIGLSEDGIGLSE